LTKIFASQGADKRDGWDVGADNVDGGVGETLRMMLELMLGSVMAPKPAEQRYSICEFNVARGKWRHLNRQPLMTHTATRQSEIFSKDL